LADVYWLPSCDFIGHVIIGLAVFGYL